MSLSPRSCRRAVRRRGFLQAGRHTIHAPKRRRSAPEPLYPHMRASVKMCKLKEPRTRPIMRGVVASKRLVPGPRGLCQENSPRGYGLSTRSRLRGYPASIVQIPIDRIYDRISPSSIQKSDKGVTSALPGSYPGVDGAPFLDDIGPDEVLFEGALAGGYGHALGEVAVLG